jgi:hypothetical protein
MKLPFHINGKGKLVNKDDFFGGIISKYLRTQAGRQALAQAMIQPILRQLDYQGIARRALMVEPMPEGGASYYFNKIEELPKFKHDKFVITPRGKLSSRKDYYYYGFNAGKVIMPTFEVFQNPTIRISDVKRRRFNLIDRKVQQARFEIMAQEDVAIFAVLDGYMGSAPPVERIGPLPMPEGWDSGPDDFWCEGCGEPRYKCYCDNVCPYGCGKWEKDCLGECQE